MKIKFKEYLDTKGETPYEFSKRAGLSIRTVKKIYEGGSIMPKIGRRVVRYCKGAISIDDLSLLTKKEGVWRESNHSDETCSLGSPSRLRAQIL